MDTKKTLEAKIAENKVLLENIRKRQERLAEQAENLEMKIRNQETALMNLNRKKK